MQQISQKNKTCHSIKKRPNAKPSSTSNAKNDCLVNNQAKNENGKLKYKLIKFHTITKFSAELKKYHHMLSVAHQHVEIFHRKEMLQMRFDKNDYSQNYVVCECHLVSHETHWVNAKYGNNHGPNNVLTLSKNIGPQSSASESINHLDLVPNEN